MLSCVELEKKFYNLGVLLLCARARRLSTSVLTFDL